MKETEKVLVAINEIVKIRLVGPTNSSYFFSEAKPERRIFFGLFRKSKAKPAGFTNGWNPPTPVEIIIRDNNHLYYNGVNILCKPIIWLSFNHLYDEKLTFNTMEEAENFVEDLINKNGLKLEVIREN